MSDNETVTQSQGPKCLASIDESFLVTRLKDFEGYGYDLTRNISYPWPLANASVPTGLPFPKINCCTFVEALLVKSWEDALLAGTKPQGNPEVARRFWNPQRHKQMMILGSDLFSPITAVIEAGMATRVEDLKTPPPPWTLVQGWRDMKAKKGGHTFLIVAERNGTVLTLEANASYNLNGVGFRGLGNAEKFSFKPPQGWWQNSALWKDGKVWTWQRIRDCYPDLQMAPLKVTRLEWAG
ncbi:hypothetical protein POL68_16985 [Stigmatella sp. ncwal1]|uniref:Peptidase C39-like domain-containing protein n=1 Tax=Stigmatella ashevillensis TaxID=2995309 RepID=A0ABT5D914_9BACT|nr:hypothetical protein [Stigmatella ashevillena]MDC0710175.1 hypothetical protein [Stigmatella ashevillena]